MTIVLSGGLGATEYRVGTQGDEAEFVPVPSAPEDFYDRCNTYYSAWVSQQSAAGSPVLQCIQPEDRAVYIDLCQRAQTGAITGADALSKWNTYMAQQCGRALCRNLYDEHVRQFPEHAECLQPYRDLILAECEKAHVWRTRTPAEALETIGLLIAKACPPPQVVAPPTPPAYEPPLPPPDAVTPPATPLEPTRTPPPVIDVVFDPTGPGEVEVVPVAQGRRRRDFGPIVGIGLLVAGAATVYRVRRKKRKR